VEFRECKGGGERIVVGHPETCFLGPNSVHMVNAKNHHIQGFSNAPLFDIAKIEPVNGAPKNGQEAKRRKSNWTFNTRLAPRNNPCPAFVPFTA
jgi:hypothetical protein